MIEKLLTSWIPWCASKQLEVLAQIQATVGGLAMGSRANETLETKAKLDNFIDQIIYNQQARD